jgi:hypothetical protein
VPAIQTGQVRGGSGVAGTLLAYNGTYWVPASQLSGAPQGTALSDWTDGQFIRISGPTGGLLEGQTQQIINGRLTGVGMRPVINVLSYGADPTGVADSSDAIQSAVDDAIAGGYANVYFPNVLNNTGFVTYKTSRPIFVHGNTRGITLEGDGCGIAVGSSGTILGGITGANTWTGPTLAIGEDIPEPIFGVSGNFNYVKIQKGVASALESHVYVNFSETDCGDISGLTAITIEFWIDPEVILPNASVNAVLGCGGTISSSLDQCFLINIQSNGVTNTLQCQLRTGGGSPALAGTQAVVPGQLNHIALVWDGSTFSQYVNGVRDATVALAGPSVVMNPYNNLCIGMVPYGYPAPGPFFWFTHEYLLASLRISNSARYAGASFTPSTTELTCDGNTKILLNFGAANRGTANSGRSGWIVGKSGCSTGQAISRVNRNPSGSPVWFRWHGTVGAGYGVQHVTVKNMIIEGVSVQIQTWVSLHNKFENLYLFAPCGMAIDLFSYEAMVERIQVFVPYNLSSNSYCFYTNSAFTSVDGLTTDGSQIQVVSSYGGKFAHLYAFPNGLLGILLNTVFSNQQTAVFDECYFTNDVGVGSSQLGSGYFYGMSYVSWRGGSLANTNNTGVTTLTIDSCDQIDMECNFGASPSTPGTITFVTPFANGPQACCRVKGQIFGDVSHLDSPLVPWMPLTGSAGQGPLVLPQRHDFGVRIVNFTSATTIGNSANLSLWVNDFLSPRLKITDTHPWLVGGATILLPLIAGYYLEIANATAQTLTFQGTTNGTTGTLASVAIATGKRAIIRCEDAAVGWVRMTPDT